MTRVPENTVRRRTLLGVVGLVFVTAGCLGAPGTTVDDPDAVATQVESRYERLDGFQATMVRTVERGGDTATTRANVAFDKGDTLRIAYQTGPKAGTVTVVDDPSATRLLTGEQADSEADAATLGALAGDLVRESEVVYEGTERLDDRSTAVFSITPADENVTERRVWIDTERVVPLRIESTLDADGRQVTETIQFEDVSLGVPQNASGSGFDGAQTSGTAGSAATGGVPS